MTDWSGHIDALVGIGVVLCVQILFNVWVFKRIRSIIEYEKTKS